MDVENVDELSVKEIRDVCLGKIISLDDRKFEERMSNGVGLFCLRFVIRWCCNTERDVARILS